LADQRIVVGLGEELLERAKPFYAEFIKQQPGNEEFLKEMGAAHFRLGHINRMLDDPDGGVRSSAAWAIGQLGYAQSAEKVIRRWQDDETSDGTADSLQDEVGPEPTETPPKGDVTALPPSLRMTWREVEAPMTLSAL
jgi:hypothetical protein